MPALAPLPSKVVTPPPTTVPALAPMLSETETEDSYVYGFYNREVGEFPMTTKKAEANYRSNRYTDFQKRYRSNNDNVQNYKYTRTTYDKDEDNMYTTKYYNDDIEDDDNDEFERAKRKTFGRERYVGNGRYYDDNGEGYYRGNERVRNYYNNPMEEYEGVYQP